MSAVSTTDLAYSDVFDSYDSSLPPAAQELRMLTDSPAQLKPFVSDSPLAPSPNTTNQQLSSAASSAHRMLHFGVPGSFVPAQQPGLAAEQISRFDSAGFPHQSQTFSTASDSESDQAHKQKFFQQLEAQWRESHTGEPIDYALLNRLTSSSFDPESSSSPEKSPLQKGKYQEGLLGSSRLLSTQSAEPASRPSDNPSLGADQAISSHSLLPQEMPKTVQSSNSATHLLAAARQSASPSASFQSAAEATSLANSPAASPDSSAVAAVSTERQFTQRHHSQASPSTAIVQPGSPHQPGGHAQVDPAAHVDAVSSSEPTSEEFTPGKAGSQGVKGSADFIVTAADTEGKPQVMERVFLTSPHLLAGMTASSSSHGMDSPGDQSSGNPAAQQSINRSPLAGASSMAQSMAAAKHPSASAVHPVASSTDNGNSNLRQSSAAAANSSPERQAALLESHVEAQAGVKLPAEAGKATEDDSKHCSPTRQQSPASRERLEPYGRPQGSMSTATEGSPVTELGLGVSPQEARLAQLIQKTPVTSRTLSGTPVGAGPLRSPAGRQTPPSSNKQDRGVSANRILDLQKQVEALKAKLQLESEARQVAHALLAAHKKEAAVAERKLREQYESKLRQKQMQLTAVQNQLQSFEGLDPKAKLSETSQVTLSEAEVRTLRRDMQEQENLIQGYQVENEAAMQQLKKMKLEHVHAHDQLTEENLRLQRALAQIQEQGVQSKVDVTDKLTAVFKLQSELEATHEKAAAREAELGQQLQQARQDRKEMEAKLAGLDLNKMQAEDEVVKQVQAEKDCVLAQLRAQMADMQRQHDQMAAELQRKLAWYAENQELVNKNSSLVKEQANTIAALEERLSLQQTTANDKVQQGDKKRIKELETDIDNLKAALKARHPDSLPVLIAAAKPSPQESALVTDLQTKLTSLQAALVRKDEEMEQELSSLRQQHDRLKLQFQARKPLQGGGQENRGLRVRELERQVEEVRSHYHHRLRSLETQLQEANSRASGNSPSKGAKQPLVPANSQQQGKKRNTAAKKKLQEELDAQTALVERLQQEVMTLWARPADRAAPDMAVPMAAAKQSDSSQSPHQKALGQQLLAPFDGQAHHARPQHHSAAAGHAEREKLTQQLEKAEQRASAAEMATATVQRAHTEAVEQFTRLQAEHQRQLTLVFQQHTAQVADLQRKTQVEEALKWRQHLAALEGQFQASRHTCDQVQEELRAARQLVPWTPAAHEFAQLAEKITQLESAEAQRSLQLQPLIQGQAAELMWPTAVARPVAATHGSPEQRQDEELEHFRTELESILAIAKELQHQQQ